MKRGEIEEQLSTTNRWWRAASGTRRTWAEDDRDLRRAAAAPYVYRPEPLADLRSGGLYMLLGPRRVGKSVEIKRAIAGLVTSGVPARRVVHAACDGWRAGDLRILATILETLAPATDGPRYLFLDEVTAVVGDWISQVKWLRDNTAVGDDCVVLSGSSSERLEDAAKDFAGRRGGVPRPNRTLLPMGFRAFCRVSRIDTPAGIPMIHPRDMLTRAAQDRIRELLPYLADLVAAWERYLVVGGFPTAVADWVDDREVSDGFRQAIWDVIHGDAFRGDDWTPPQTQTLLHLIARGLTTPFNATAAARDLGHIHHETLRKRLARLEQSYVIWSCHRDDNGRPKLQAQRKLYFLDPIHACLARARSARAHLPDLTQLTEQQLGVALLRVHEHDDPDAFARHDQLLYHRTSTNREIDFVALWLGGIPYEGKYTEGRWLRDAQTAATAFRQCVLATRNVTDRVSDDTRDLLAVPAAVLALLFDPTSDGAARPQ